MYLNYRVPGTERPKVKDVLHALSFFLVLETHVLVKHGVFGFLGFFFKIIWGYPQNWDTKIMSVTVPIH